MEMKTSTRGDEEEPKTTNSAILDTSEEGRFRVDRICSVAAGMHRSPGRDYTVDQDHSKLQLPEITLETEEPMDSNASDASTVELSEYPAGTIGGKSEDASKMEDNNAEVKKNQDRLESLPVASDIGFERVRKFSQNPGSAGPRRYRQQSDRTPKVSADNSGDGQFYVSRRRKTSVFLPEIDQADFDYWGKDLEQFTLDKVPKEDNYRNMQSIHAVQARPTLGDLLGDDEQSRENEGTDTGKDKVIQGEKFGWIRGVFIRCILNIWGVMLFLRVGWMVAQAGIIQSLLIIVLSSVVTVITTLSMSAVSTNGEIKGGGIYYMISRGLGPEWGCAIGFVFSFANAGMAALNIVGFSECVIALLDDYGLSFLDGGINENRVISVATVIVLQLIIVVGKEYEAKTQLGLLFILLLAMADYIFGAFYGPRDAKAVAKGFSGMSAEVLKSNLGPGYRPSDGLDNNFFVVFSIFFPSVAGIQAGASISGDLKDPGSAIPKGTLLAIFVTSASYAFFAVLAGAGAVRDATGNLADYNNVTGIYSGCVNTTCKYGLYNDYEVMNLIAYIGPYIYAGAFAASLSSALSCLISGSEMFQALGKDEIYPYTGKLGKGYTKSQDPYWSYALVFVIGLVFILIGNLNAIAPLISNMFMVTYILLNFSAFHGAFLQPIGWRPSFKYFHWSVGLFGVLLCFVTMFLMDVVSSIVSLCIVLMIWYGGVRYKPDINWGDTTQDQAYQVALSSLQKISSGDQHVKNYRPQILALSGQPSSRPVLIDFARLFSQNKNLLICGNICRNKTPGRARNITLRNGYEWLSSVKLKAFYTLVDNTTLHGGANALMQTVGVGRLSPNIILLGFKSDWNICDREEVKEYFSVLNDAFENHKAIAILRVKEGLDVSHLATVAATKSGALTRDSSKANGVGSAEYDNKITYDPTDPESQQSPPAVTANNGSEKKCLEPAKLKGNKLVFGKGNKKGNSTGIAGVYRSLDGSELPQSVIENISRFSKKQPTGMIDVWWLYDDGGLTLLLPYIISTRKNWSSCKLRVFALSNKKDEIEMEARSMASLLSKFRIDYTDLTVIPDITKKAENQTKAFFDSLIKNFKDDPETADNPETIITDAELLALKEKTNRHLRLRELLLEYSKSSNLVVMTMPVPRIGTVSAPLYLAWLECLTRDMPPFLLVRGNQTSVLTFYS